MNARGVSGFCYTLQALPPVQYASLASMRMPKVCRTKYSEMRSCHVSDEDLQMTRNVAVLAGCCLLAKHIKHTRAEKADATGPRRHMHGTKLHTMFLRGRVHHLLAVRRRPVLQPTRWNIMIFADSRRLLPSLCASQNQSPFSIQLTLASPAQDQRWLNEHSGHGRRRGRLHRGV